jgi:integrase
VTFESASPARTSWSAPSTPSSTVRVESRSGGTLADLSAWLDYRHDQGARRDDPFVCSLQSATLGQPLNRHVLRRRFHTACRVLGWDRLRNLTIHHWRHTFISHALAGGRTLAEVKAAAGHASLLTTSVYLHVVVDEREDVGALFAAGR